MGKEVSIRSMRTGATKKVPAKHADLLVRLGKYEYADELPAPAKKPRKVAPGAIVEDDVGDDEVPPETDPDTNADGEEDEGGSDNAPVDDKPKPRRKYNRRDMTAEE